MCLDKTVLAISTESLRIFLQEESIFANWNISGHQKVIKLSLISVNKNKIWRRTRIQAVSAVCAENSFSKVRPNMFSRIDSLVSDHGMSDLDYSPNYI